MSGKGEVRTLTGQVRSGQIRSDQVMSGPGRSGQVISEQDQNVLDQIKARTGPGMIR